MVLVGDVNTVSAPGARMPSLLANLPVGVSDVAVIHGGHRSGPGEESATMVEQMAEADPRAVLIGEVVCVEPEFYETTGPEVTAFYQAVAFPGVAPEERGG